MPNHRGWKLRTHFWLNTEVQGRFIVFFVVACAVISVLLVCVVFAFVWPTMSKYVSIAGPSNPVEWFAQSLTHAIIAAGVVFVICAVFGAVLFVFQSHRIAGPIYRIQRLLDADDEPESRSLRSGDALQDLYAKTCLVMAKKAKLKRRYDELFSLACRLCEELRTAGTTSIEHVDVYKELNRIVSGEKDDEPKATDKPEDAEEET